jgi:hypothetical protein
MDRAVSQDFLRHIFWWISFPKLLQVSNYSHFEFFKISRKYSHLKVHHRCCWHQWQLENIFKQKSFKNLVWTPLCSRDNIKINFSFSFTLRCKYSDVVPIMWHQYRWHQFQICRRFQQQQWYRRENLPPVSLYIGAPWLENISENFPKIRNDPNVVFRFFWGEDDSWKNLRQKISWHSPLNHTVEQFCFWKNHCKTDLLSYSNTFL